MLDVGLEDMHRVEAARRFFQNLAITFEELADEVEENAELVDQVLDTDDIAGFWYEQIEHRARMAKIEAYR